MRPLGIALSAMMVFSGLTVVEGTPAVAAEPVLVSGTVFADANKSNTLDSDKPAGETDLGVEDVSVTLACFAPEDNAHTGWTTQTDASGHWSFPADTGWATDCADDQLHVTINLAGTAVDAYAVHTAASTDNAFIRLGTANQQARSATFSAQNTPTVLNALVWPTWKLDLKLPNVTGGLDGKAVFTGSEPWDDLDQSAADALVRSGDVTKFTWNVTAGAEEPLADSFKSTVLEQTILLGEGAVANFTGIPATCSGAGTKSEIRAFAGTTDVVGTPIEPRTVPPVGTTHVSLSCNLGQIGLSTSAILLDTSIWASPNSVNGAEFTSMTRVYGVNPAGIATAQPSGPVETGPIEIVSMPR